MTSELATHPPSNPVWEVKDSTGEKNAGKTLSGMSEKSGNFIYFVIHRVYGISLGEQ